GGLGRDAGVEAAAGDGDREGVLRVLPARLDALVAEDALRVVAHVQVVVDLGRLGDRGGGSVPGRRVVAGVGAVARAVLGGRGLRAEALGARLVAPHVPLDLGG